MGINNLSMDPISRWCQTCIRMAHSLRYAWLLRRERSRTCNLKITISVDGPYRLAKGRLQYVQQFLGWKSNVPSWSSMNHRFNHINRSLNISFYIYCYEKVPLSKKAIAQRFYEQQYFCRQTTPSKKFLLEVVLLENRLNHHEKEISVFLTSFLRNFKLDIMNFKNHWATPKYF